MKIGLIQVDGKMPNLALMKLSRFHREKGDEVEIIDLSGFKFDKIYASKIFIGGSGFDVNCKLPDGIERLIPDYEKFNLDYSIGFTSRGCIRDCGFCIVKEKEGNLQEVDIAWIKHSKVILMDNNFLASPNWKEKLQYFIDNEIKVNFNQGLDIRLIDDEKAELLSKVKSYNRTFSRKVIYFAFDNPNLENIIIDKINILKKFIKPNQIMVYILIGYNTTFEADMKRFKICIGLGVDPYIQVFNNIKTNKKVKDLARWVNKRIYKVCTFEEYKKK